MTDANPPADDLLALLQAASEFIRDVHEALHGARPGQEDIVNLVELARVVKERVAPETTALRDALDRIITINTACDGNYQWASTKTCEIAYEALHPSETS